MGREAESTVRFKYGDQAALLAGTSLQAVGNTGQAAMHLKSLGPKALAKGTAKRTAVGVVKHVGGGPPVGAPALPRPPATGAIPGGKAQKAIASKAMPSSQSSLESDDPDAESHQHLEPSVPLPHALGAYPRRPESAEAGDALPSYADVAMEDLVGNLPKPPEDKQ